MLRTLPSTVTEASFEDLQKEGLTEDDLCAIREVLHRKAGIFWMPRLPFSHQISKKHDEMPALFTSKKKYWESDSFGVRAQHDHPPYTMTTPNLSDAPFWGPKHWAP